MLIEPSLPSTLSCSPRNAEQTGQGDHEAGHAEARAEQAVEQPDDRTGRRATPRSASSSGQPWLTKPTARIAADRPLTEPTDRSISPSSSTSTMPSAIVPIGGALQGEVDQVAAGQERRVRDLEDRPDDDQADDHRQRAEVAAAQPGDEGRRTTPPTPCEAISRSSCRSAGRAAVASTAGTPRRRAWAVLMTAPVRSGVVAALAPPMWVSRRAGALGDGVGRRAGDGGDDLLRWWSG